MKRKIAFVLMASLLSSNVAFAGRDEQININLEFDADMFLKTTTNATMEYDVDILYYDGSKYEEEVTIGDMTYKLGNLDTQANDVIKIDASDVTVQLDNSASRNIGIVLFTADKPQNSEIILTVNYEGGKKDSYVVDVPEMTDVNEFSEGYNPLKVKMKNILVYNVIADTSKTVYLHDEIIDTSKSVNKNLNVESITFGAADFVYYVAAINQVKFSASELEDQTKEAVANLYDKYANLNFVDLFEETDGVNCDEAQELYSAMLKQEGKMDVATAENIEKIENLIKSYELYVEIKGYKDEIDGLLGDYPEKSADFINLSETDLTDADFENLKSLLALYESVKGFDSDAFEGYVEMYDLADSIDVAIDMENEEKIKALHDSYEKAAKREELRGKIDGIYASYEDKAIAEITDADLDKLAELVSYFDEAEELGIEFEEYNDKYIRHLYGDYESFKTSEEKKTIDLSGAYNVDVFGTAGEMADKNTWYECSDNLNGGRFTTGNHANIISYDKNTGIIYLKELEYVETSKYDPLTEITTVTYPFTATGDTIPFYMPESVFRTTVCDAILMKANGKEKYTFDMSSIYTDKLYFAISAKNTTKITPVVTYSDGTTESYSVSVHNTGMAVDAVRKNQNTYIDMVSYVTSGNYKDQNMATTGVVYEADGSTTNGLLTFAVTLNPKKIPVSVTFASAGVEYVLYGASQKPVANDVIAERTETLYSEVVKDGVADTSDLKKISELVLNYNDASARGLYFENIDEDILAELSKMVLTAKGEAFRTDKDTVKAEIEFSVAVAKETVKENISVTVNGEEVDNFDYEIDAEAKKITLDIPTDRSGEKELKIKVSDNVKIKDYPQIGMVSALEISYKVPEYIAVQYSGSTLKITNNSKVSQDYFVYATVVDNGKVIGVEKSEGVVEGEGSKNVVIDTTIYDTETSVKHIAVLDKNTLAPLAEVTETEKETGTTNKSADYKKPALNLETDVLKIEGVTPSKEEKVISVVLYSPTGDIIYAGVKNTNADGYFNMEIPVSTEKIPVSGYFKIMLGGDDFSEAVVIEDLYFPVLSARTDIISQLKNATSVNEIAEILKEAEEKLSLNFEPFNELKKSDSSLKALAARVEKIKADLPTVSDSDSEAVKKEKISKVQNIIKQQSVLECIETGKSDLVAKDGELLYNDIMLWSSIDDNGVTLYSLYENNISEDGRKAVVDGLLKNDYETADEIYDDLEKLIMLNALKNPKGSGVGYVEDALTKENAAAADMTTTKYLNLKDKSKANSGIANMSISSLSDVEEYIRKISDGNVADKPSGGLSGGSGGGSSMGGISVVPLTENIAGITVEENETFADVNKNHWAYEAIENLTQKGIINGKGSGKFDPDGIITRAEFVKILCVAKDIKAEGPIYFTDVERYAWYEEYVATAFNAGIVNGISETEFGVNNPISRQDICTILYRTMDAENAGKPQFVDNADISAYAQDAVAFFALHGVVGGFADGTFKPLESCTRAQAAKIIYNYLNM